MFSLEHDRFFSSDYNSSIQCNLWENAKYYKEENKNELQSRLVMPTVNVLRYIQLHGLLFKTVVARSVF